MAGSKTVLLEDQCYTISSFLMSAAVKFAELAETAAEKPAMPALAEQFKRQHEQAKKFATLFSNAINAEVTLEEE